MTQESLSWEYIWTKISFKKIHAPSMFIATLFTVAKTWKQPKCPSTDEWIKMIYIYTVEYHSAIKMNEIVSFTATWMDLEIIKLSEVRKRQKPYSIIYM